MNDAEAVKWQSHFYQTTDYLSDKLEDKLLILGIGNVLMGDEGAGVHLIHSLAKEKLPENIDILDGGTGSFNLMPLLAGYKKVVFVDATMDEDEPGTIRVRYPKFAADFPTALSAHDVGLKDMLNALEFNGELPEIALVTIRIPAIIPMTTEISEVIQKQMDALKETVLKAAKTLCHK